MQTYLIIKNANTKEVDSDFMKAAYSIKTALSTEFRQSGVTFEEWINSEVENGNLIIVEPKTVNQTIKAPNTPSATVSAISAINFSEHMTECVACSY